MTRQATLAWALVLVVAGLSGCIGGGDGTNEPTTTNSAPGTGNMQAAGQNGNVPASTDAPALLNVTPRHLVGNISFEGCSLHVGLIPLPAQMAEAFMPPGWDAVPFQGIPGVFQGFIAGSVCDAVDGQARDDSLPMLMAGVLTEPSAAYTGAVDVHAVILGIVLEDADIQERIEVWNISADVAEITASTTSTAAFANGVFDASWDGFGVRLVSDVPGAPFDLGSTSMRIFEIQGEHPAAAVDLRWTTGAGIGPGVMVVSVGDRGLPTEPLPQGIGVFLGGTPDFGLRLTPVALPADLAAMQDTTETPPGTAWQLLRTLR